MAKKHRRTAANKQYVLNNSWATTKKDMAAYLGIDVRTLEKYYSEEMSQSTAGIMSEVVIATKGALQELNASVINNLLKTVGGLTETNKLELTGKDGDPIQYVDRPPKLSREEWIAAHSKVGEDGSATD